MNNFLSRKTRTIVLKTSSVFTGMTTVLSLSGLLYFAPVASAVAPSDYGLKEGDTVSAAGSSDPDIYIVNEMGFKRLFLNPVIFNFYGHLGGFAKVKNVSSATRDAFGTSGLFRNCETGDEKVYGVETTGEDTGMLHWVNTSGAKAVADDPNFFKKVFCVNNNEFNWYSKGSDYTSVSQVPNYSRQPGVTPTPVVGAVSVSLASGNPVAATVTKNAQGVEMLRVKLSGSGTVNEMTVKRLGAGATGDFTNLYWYEGAKRLTSGKSLSSSTGEVTFANLTIDVSGSKELSLVADLTATGGNVNYFQLNAVKLSSGSIGGLPLNGNLFTISGSNGGTVTMDKVGSLANPTVGQKGAQLSEFKITANTEAASVKRITMLQGGTVKPADITNLKVKAGSTEWSGSIDKAGYAVFDLGAGFFIAKGGDQVFKVYADLGGKKDEDVNLYFENATDILAVGDQYGFGMAATITSMDTAGEAFDVTLQGGVLTISFNGPTASSIGTDTADTVLLKFTMIAVSNIEVRKTELTLCQDPGADGSFANSADTTNGWADLDDFKVVNADTGVTVLGPQDGSAFTTSDAGTCASSATGAQKTFTDVFELSAGKTSSFKVTADIKTSNSRSGTALVAGDAIQVYLDNYTDDTPDVTVMKYAGTNTSVADADIVPQSDMAGPSMTISASSLTLGRSTSVISQTVVRGSKDVKAVTLNFTAGAASDMKVTDIVLSGYARDNTSGAYTLGAENASGIAVANLVSKVKLYDGDALLSETPASNQLSNTTGTVTFNNLSWTIPAGSTKTLLVKTDLSSNATSASSNDFFAFDIAATGDVTALDSASKTVNAAAASVAPNGTTSPSTAVTVANSGSITTAIHPDTPSKHSVYWGQAGDVAGMWRLNATNEGQLVENLLFAEDDSGQQADLRSNAKLAYLTYKNKAGTELTATGTFDGNASLSFGFSGDNRPYIPKDGSLNLTLKLDYKTKAEGATSTGAADSTSPVFDVALMTAVDTNATFKAVGEGSGVVINGGDTGLTANRDQNGNTVVYVYRVYPEFALVAPTSTNLNTVDPVLRFIITAKGLPDSRLLFDNENNASGSIKFAVIASGVGSNNVAVTIRDAADSSTVDTETITNATLKAPAASLTINFSSKDLEIAGGGSKTLVIILDSTTNFSTPINTSAGVGADYFQLVLRDNESAFINWVDNSDGTTNSFDVPSVTGNLRLLPLNGYQFKAN